MFCEQEYGMIWKAQSVNKKVFHAVNIVHSSFELVTFPIVTHSTQHRALSSIRRRRHQGFWYKWLGQLMLVVLRISRAGSIRGGHGHHSSHSAFNTVDSVVYCILACSDQRIDG